MRTDSPVWEQGFTFFVANPDNDTLQLRIVDQKTEKEIGRYTYIMSGLLQTDDLSVNAQPFRLQKSGPESIITMSLVLRIFKKYPNQDDDAISQHSSTPNAARRAIDDGLSRTSSVRSTKLIDSVPVVVAQQQQPLQKQESKLSMYSQTSSAAGTDADSNAAAAAVEEAFIESLVSVGSQLSATPSGSDNNGGSPTLLHRTPSVTSSAGAAGLGRIQLTIRYSIHRQRLIVIVHKIMYVFTLVFV